MNDLQLEQLSKEELIKIILNLKGVVDAQMKEINDLRKEINSLRSKVERADRASKRQAAPFRRDEKELKKKKKKPGREPGHKGHYRKFTGTPDRDIDVKLTKCPGCGHSKFLDVKKTEQYVQDIVAKVVTTRLTTYSGKCSHCDQEIQTDHPLKISNGRGAAGTYIGPVARNLALNLDYKYGLSKRKITDILDNVFGLNISPGGLVHMGHKAAGILKEDFDSLVESVRSSEVIHADETSWYVGEPKHWLWTFTNKDHCLYHVINSRARQVIYDILGKNYEGVLVSDCLAIYDDVNEDQQKCYAHHLKALNAAEELVSKHPEDLQLIRAIKIMLKSAIQIKKVRNVVSKSRYKTAIKNLENQANELIPSLQILKNDIKKAPYRRYQESTIGVLKRLSRQKDHLFTFLHYEYVDATNNLAERRLRPAVISRKISCGNKTDKGAKTWCILTSLLQTWNQKEISFKEKLTQAYHNYLTRPIPT